MKGIQRHFHLSKKEVRGLLGLWVVLVLLSALGLYSRRPPDVSIIKGEEPVQVSELNEVKPGNEIQEDSTYVCDPNVLSLCGYTDLNWFCKIYSHIIHRCNFCPHERLQDVLKALLNYRILFHIGHNQTFWYVHFERLF